MNRVWKFTIDQKSYGEIIDRRKTALVCAQQSAAFQVGDTVWLKCETDDHAMMRTVGHVDHSPGVAPGYAVLSLV